MIELTQEQQEKAVEVQQQISEIMNKAAFDYTELALRTINSLPANDFILQSDSLIRSASIQAAELVVNLVKSDS